LITTRSASPVGSADHREPFRPRSSHSGRRPACTYPHCCIRVAVNRRCVAERDLRRLTLAGCDRSGNCNEPLIPVVLEGHACQRACAQLNPSLASRERRNALIAREPQEAADRVETTSRQTGRVLRFWSHRRRRRPRCSTCRKAVMPPCFEIPRGPRMSTQRPQERSTRGGHKEKQTANSLPCGRVRVRSASLRE